MISLLRKTFNIPSRVLIYSVFAPTLLPHDCVPQRLGQVRCPSSRRISVSTSVCRGSVSRQTHKEFN